MSKACLFPIERRLDRYGLMWPKRGDVLRVGDDHVIVTCTRKAQVWVREWSATDERAA